MKRWQVWIDGGLGGSTTIMARDFRSAMAWAREWTRGGVWEKPCNVVVCVVNASCEVEEKIRVGPLTAKQLASSARRLARLSAREPESGGGIV